MVGNCFIRSIPLAILIPAPDTLECIEASTVGDFRLEDGDAMTHVLLSLSPPICELCVRLLTATLFEWFATHLGEFSVEQARFMGSRRTIARSLLSE